MRREMYLSIMMDRGSQVGLSASIFEGMGLVYVGLVVFRLLPRCVCVFSPLWRACA